ncbi:hypothetical protein [Bartonella sp. B1099]|uniref:hypothetical protein n=1 Tax=Bartonella sp. B1099 TaxID=2911422 RepID=UPI0020C419E0|nr:hypothetical protein [Bartonella sp. B1099]
MRGLSFGDGLMTQVVFKTKKCADDFLEPLYFSCERDFSWGKTPLRILEPETEKGGKSKGGSVPSFYRDGILWGWRAIEVAFIKGGLRRKTDIQTTRR